MPWILLVVALGALALFAKRAVAADSAPSVTAVRQYFDRAAARFGVDADLLHAIAMVESSLDPNAVRWNPPRDVSVGLMQILAVPPEGTAEGTDYIPINKFNISPWPVSFRDLMDPQTNVNLGAQIVAWNIKTFGFPRGIAVYNRWASRTDPINGPFGNQAYVDKVLRNYANLKGE